MGLICVKPLFLSKLRPERLTSNQMVSEQALPGGTSSPSISLGPNGWGPLNIFLFTELFSGVQFEKDHRNKIKTKK